MKKFFREFREFATRGSVVDLAVGMIIGSAFTSIVNSVVNDIISPIVGLFTKNNFDTLSIKVDNVTIKYGSFVMAIINFIITAFIVFILVKTINKARNLMQRGKTNVVANKKICPYCKSEISAMALRCPNCTSKLDGYHNDNE